MRIDPAVVYPSNGYPMLLPGRLELFLGGILLRRSRGQRGVARSAGTMASVSALFCLSTGLAYVLTPPRPRERDVPARCGGEPSAVILPETDGARAAAVAERVRAAVEGLGVEGLCVTISAGVSAWRAGLLADGFIHQTDRWLYEAKRRGRNRVCAAPFP